MRSREVYQEINELTSRLVELGISIEQNFPSYRLHSSGTVSVDWGKSNNLSIALKNIEYPIIYQEITKSNHYNVKLVDGGLIQYMYYFLKDTLISHRLAFYPNPILEDFQQNEDLVDGNGIYKDLLYKNIVPFPIRFDYNESDEEHIEIDHSKSHLTLGHFKNCRIPVMGPLTPSLFTDFILRNFYSTFYNRNKLNLIDKNKLFSGTITDDEKHILHLNIN